MSLIKIMNERAGMFATSLLLVTAGVGCGGPSIGKIDVQLTAPPVGQGFQLSTPEFEVPAGAEVQDCYFVQTPNVETWVNHIITAQNPGTHHMNLFRLGTKGALWGNPGDVVHGGECWNSGNWADWPLVANSQISTPTNPVNDWTLPDGVGMKFDPNEVLMLQTHYINATVQKTPGEGHVLINLFSQPKESFTMELGTFFATNQNIRICPGEIDKSFSASCLFASAPVTITAANSHFHSHGIEFDISTVDAQGVETPFYHNTSWDSPLWDTNLNIPIAPGGGISYTCAYTVEPTDCGDPNDQCCVDFGPHNQTQEHCNVFLYYYPKLPSQVVCF